MTRLLILVHGMGTNPPGWSADIVTLLDKLAAQYTAFSNGAASFSSQCTIAEVRYDGVFERYIEDWKASADAFSAFQKKYSVPLPTLMTWLTSSTLPGDQKNFFWSTLLDPVLYRGFPLVRDEVRSTVMSQIVGHCTANMTAGSVEASILAHSLGTAAVHDVLQLLATKPQLGNNSFTAAAGWHFESLFMLADVCRLGPPALIDMPDSAAGYLVRPRSAGTPGDNTTFYCNRLYSFRHELDPFVCWTPFLPSNWGADFVSPNPLTAIHQANVHGFTHYLSDPAVHIPIINAVLGYSAISTKETLDAIANYPPVGSPECSAQVAKLKAMLAQLPNAGQNLEQLAILGSQFYATAQQLATECKGLASI